MSKGKGQNKPSLNVLYSMTELPPAETVRIKQSPAPSVQPKEPIWAEYTQDDKDLFFSQSLSSVAAKASRQQQQTIKEFIEEDIAIACADQMKNL
jgi:hypothetical protein